MILGFGHEMDENCALVGYYTGSSDNFLPTWDNLLIPSSGVKDPNGSIWSLDPMKMGPRGCSEMPVSNYHYAPHNIPEEPNSHNIALFNHLLLTVPYV
jgi:hypothetical protein